MNFKAQIMDEAAVDRTLVRIAHQIVEKNQGTQDLCLIGIKTRGVPLAQRLAQNILRIEGVQVPVGKLDITLYRDDLSPLSDAPVVSDTHIPFSIQGKTVVLVDDVIFTTRTARAAMDARHCPGASGADPAVCPDRPGARGVPHPAELRGKEHPHRPAGGGGRPPAGNRRGDRRGHL